MKPRRRTLRFSFSGFLAADSRDLPPETLPGWVKSLRGGSKQVEDEIAGELRASIDFPLDVTIAFPAEEGVEWLGTVDIDVEWSFLGAMATNGLFELNETIRSVVDHVLRRRFVTHVSRTVQPLLKTRVTLISAQAVLVSSSRRLAEIAILGMAIIVAALAIAQWLVATRSGVLPNPERSKSESSQKLDVTSTPSPVGQGSSKPTPETRAQLVGSLASLIERALTQAGEAPKIAADVARKAGEAFVTSLASDAGKQVIPLLGRLFDSLSEPAPELRWSIEFGLGSSALSPSALRKIDEVRRFCQQHNRTIVLLRANTDTSGSSALNRVIARRRGEAVRDALTREGGVARNRIFVAELAEEDLPVITDHNIMEPRNRAVLIAVR